MSANPIVHWPLVRVLGKQRYLALSLLAFLFIMPVVAEPSTFNRLLTYVVLTFVCITGPFAIASTPGRLMATIILALMVLLPGIASILGDYQVAHSYSMLAGTLFFGFLALLISKELLTDDTAVDSETLWGAVNVYVLIGLCFAFAYAALATFQPDLFTGKFIDQSSRDQIFGYIYFSFVTLTTLGYGDITPNSTGVATLTYLEAVIGQLYIAIMLARLVGLYITRKTP